MFSYESYCLAFYGEILKDKAQTLYEEIKTNIIWQIEFVGIFDDKLLEVLKFILVNN